MATFGLVHGAYHGSWCWEKLKAVLEQRGHRVLTVDLPCEDPEAGAAEYAQVTIEAFADAPDDLVLVGHSLGGLTIPLVATQRPVGQMVFLCAMVPRLGRTQNDVVAEEPDMVLAGPDEGAYTGIDGATRWHTHAAARWFFADCRPDVAVWAASQLRGQFWKITEEVTPIQSWPAAPSRAIIGSHDLVISPAWSWRVIPSVLGISPIDLDCGHSPFLSAPELLADALIDSP